MKFSLWALLIIQMFTTASVFAHGPTPQKIDESIEISAPIKQVWQQIEDFSKISDWHPLIDSVTMEDEMTRVINIKDKGNLTESLDEKNNKDHYLSYRLYEEDITVFPVSFYTITIQLSEDNDQTKLSWSGRFYRADTGNFPAPEYSDEAAVKAMTDFAVTGMQSLKTMLEAK